MILSIVIAVLAALLALFLFVAFVVGVVIFVRRRDRPLVPRELKRIYDARLEANHRERLFQSSLGEIAEVEGYAPTE